MSEKVLRTRVYLQRPREYGLSGCPQCGNADPEWSEFQKHCWCPTCQIDFEPTEDGVFGGPILMQMAALFGMFFDSLVLETGQVERYDFDSQDWVTETPEQYEISRDEKRKALHERWTAAMERTAAVKKPRETPAVSDTSGSHPDAVLAALSPVTIEKLVEDIGRDW